MSVVAFRTAPLIDGLSCLYIYALVYQVTGVYAVQVREQMRKALSQICGLTIMSLSWSRLCMIIPSDRIHQHRDTQTVENSKSLA